MCPIFISWSFLLNQFELFELATANWVIFNDYYTQIGDVILSRKKKDYYRLGTLNSNTVNSKFHLIRSFFEIFARFLSFHV